jgi:hypothetical protein
VPVQEPGEVLPREGRLLAGDRVQRNGRIGEDPLAVAAGDAAVLGGPLGLLATVLPPRSSFWWPSGSS